MPGSLFREGGVWLRCQFHSHTTNSDGMPSPAALCDHYADAGFDALAITDHWHVTDVDHDRLVVIPSSELTAANPSAHGEAEVLALGVSELPEPSQPFPDIEALAAWITARGGVPFLCHPYWSGLRVDDLLAAPSLAGLEIWNGGSEIMQGNGLSTVHWDDALQQGRLLMGIATDDCHTPGEDSGFGWTWVLAQERSAAAVIDALRRGRAYGSAGPRLLDIVIEEESVVVRCSPVRSVRLRSGPWDGCGVNADPAMGNWRGEVCELDTAGLVTGARFEYPEFWRWARVEVEDERGRRAWSNPFVLPGAGEGTDGPNTS
ncbi:MAG: hypothetical protein EXQ81_05000 [Thermoleophilia bacterium]|nr:hypothetical protein [Thermoleophilia bacterium]